MPRLPFSRQLLFDCGLPAEERRDRVVDLINFKTTVDKLLDCPKRGPVQFDRTAQQPELYAKFPLQRLGVIADNFQTTAFCGAFGSKGGNDHMASLLHGAGGLADVSGTVTWGSEKMKDGAVMPHIVSRGFQRDLRNVPNEPTDALRGSTQSFPVRVDGSLRNIQNRDVLVSVSEKIVDQSGFSPADIDNG